MTRYFFLTLAITCFAFQASFADSLTQLRAPNNLLPNGDTNEMRISGDGTIIVIVSSSRNLVENDTNDSDDVFVYEIATGTLTRISVASDGTQANSDSENIEVTHDGRYIVFGSQASNLVENDTNGVFDCFLHDRTTSTTTRVSVASDGTEANGASCDEPVDLSDDAEVVVFSSAATNLVANDSNAEDDIFEHRRANGKTTRVSITSSGFESNGASRRPTISRDGQYITFDTIGDNFSPADTNATDDVVYYDRSTGLRNLISINSDGAIGNSQSILPKISPDGRYVTFYSLATNLVSDDTNGVFDGFLYDADSSSLTRVFAPAGIEANNNTGVCDLSDQALYIICVTEATNFAPDTNGFFDVFVQARIGGTVQRISIRDDGTELNGLSRTPAISADGTIALFSSNATNAIEGEVGSFVQGYYALNDTCRADLDKLAPGVCGCGVSDADANGNGNADCLDPTAETKPNAPTLSKVGRSRIAVEMDAFADANVSYSVRARAKIRFKGKKQRVKRTRSSESSNYEFRGLKKAAKKTKARWSIDYTVSAGSTTSQRSERARIRF